MATATVKLKGAPSARLKAAATEAATCHRCGLYRGATQTVFGQGRVTASIMMVGEQPGDQEDLAGKPFVGPAGRLLDRAMVDAGLDRRAIYITNTVKHFKFERRGKKRIHMKPRAEEIGACRWWLDLEVDAIRPRLIIALGVTAATALAGHHVVLSRERGKALAFAGDRQGFVTVHPSSILRIPSDAERHKAYAAFVSDLKLAGRLAAKA